MAISVSVSKFRFTVRFIRRKLRVLGSYNLFIKFGVVLEDIRFCFLGIFVVKRKEKSGRYIFVFF